MKTILLFFTIIFINASSYSHSKDDDYKTMVDSAIVIQTMHSDKIPYHPGIYLIDSKDQAYILTSDTNQKKFSYINLYDKKNKRLLKKGVNVWKVLPVLSGNRLIINIMDFSVTYKKNNYNFANGGGATVIFEYLCDKNKWVFRETKWFGI